MKVRPIVMKVRSRPSLIRFVMSSLVSVWLIEWTVKPGAVGLDRGDRVADGHEVALDLVLVAGDPADDPGRRQVAGDEAGLRRRGRGVLDLVEDRDGRRRRRSRSGP